MSLHKDSVKDDTPKWDFFLAHAGPDLTVAEELYELLVPYKAFLDSKSLLLGDDWDRELPLAQSSSRITIVLVSANTDQAYYEREEIAAAIRLARQDGDKHRVVPVFLETSPDETKVPYGLLRKHSLYLSREGDLAKIADRLKTLYQQVTAGVKSEAQSSRASNELPKFERILLEAISRFTEDELLAEIIAPLVAILHPGRIDYLTLPDDPNRFVISSGSDRIRRPHVLAVQLKRITSSTTVGELDIASQSSLSARRVGLTTESGLPKFANEVWLITPYELDLSFRTDNAEILGSLERENITFIQGNELVDLIVEHLPDIASKLSKYSAPEVIGLISALSRHMEGKAFGLSIDRTVNSFYVTAALSPHATKAYAALRGEVLVKNWRITDDVPVDKLLKIADLFLDSSVTDSHMKKRAVQWLTEGRLDRFKVNVAVRFKQALTEVKKKYVQECLLQTHDFRDLSSFIVRLRDGSDGVSLYLRKGLSEGTLVITFFRRLCCLFSASRMVTVGRPKVVFRNKDSVVT